MKRRDFLFQSAGTLMLTALPGSAGAGAHNPEARVQDHNGSPALFIDGEPFPPMLFTGNPTRPEYIESLGNSGIRIYFLECDLEWSLPGGFAKLKNRADRILRHFPGALFIIRRCFIRP